MIINSPYISGSQTTTGNAVITGSLTVLGGIIGAITGSAVSASYALSASYAATSSYADNFKVGDTLTVQTIIAQVITSSTEYITGSTIFGSSLSNTHQFTGSVSVTGSFNSAQDIIVNGVNIGEGEEV